MKSGVEFLLALKKAFAKLGSTEGTNGTRIPRVNDPKDKAVLELAVASDLKREAEDRAELARSGVLGHFSDSIEQAAKAKGRVNIHASAHASLDVHVIKGSTRLNKDTLRLELMKRVGVKDADAIIAACSEVGSPQVRLTATIVQMPSDG